MDGTISVKLSVSESEISHRLTCVNFLRLISSGPLRRKSFHMHWGRRRRIAIHLCLYGDL